MFKTLAGVIASGILLASTFANAGDQPYKAAMKQATTNCRAEVKERAKSLSLSTRRLTETNVIEHQDLTPPSSQP